MENIKITGAYENNLKHISLEIPKKRITIFTGVSGSGKSSLVLDTIAASSRRELNETFPSFVQQYLPKYGRPHVDKIEHLPVAIVIDQKKPAPTPALPWGLTQTSILCSGYFFPASASLLSVIPTRSPSIIRKEDVPAVTDWEKYAN